MVIEDSRASPVFNETGTSVAIGDLFPKTDSNDSTSFQESMRNENKENIENEAVKEDEVANEEAANTAIRYQRLMHILQQSEFYATYLVKTIETQRKEEEEKKAKKEQARKKREEELAKSPPGQAEASSSSVTRSTRNQGEKTKGKESPKAASAKTQPRKGRKRKMDDYNIADVITKDDILEGTKRRKVEENAKESLASRSSTDSDADRQPAFFKGVLRPYQIEGYEWIKTLYDNGVNAILGDEMGLGKTVQCIALICYLAEMGVKGPFLVVGPLSTLLNWKVEMERFAPEIPAVVYHGRRDEREKKFKLLRKLHRVEDKFSFPVCITNYDLVMRDRRQLSTLGFKLLIIDEGHRIKNMDCRLLRELKYYNISTRFLLTGTPLQNNLSELWSLLNFLLPEIFGSRNAFEQWFDVADMIEDEASEKIISQEREKNVVSTLHKILSPFLLRRLKTEVNLELPPKKELLVYAPMSQLQKKLYDATVENRIFDVITGAEEAEEEEENLNRTDRRCRNMVTNNGKILSGCTLDEYIQAIEERESSRKQLRVSMEKKKTKQSQLSVFRNKMMQCRKIANHPYLVDHPLNHDKTELLINEDLISCCGKLKLLEQMLCELNKRGHKVLIFSQMTKMLDLIQDMCDLRDYKHFRIDGNVSLDDRQQAISSFGKSEEWIFLVSTRAGGLGINLTAADTVIIYDSDWNPQCDLQAQDRCHRIGQVKPVVVYRLMTKDSIDERIVMRAKAKRRLEKIVIQKGRFSETVWNAEGKFDLNEEELQELLTSKDYAMGVDASKNILTKKQVQALLDRKAIFSGGKDLKGVFTVEQ